MSEPTENEDSNTSESLSISEIPQGVWIKPFVNYDSVPYWSDESDRRSKFFRLPVQDFGDGGIYTDWSRNPTFQQSGKFTPIRPHLYFDGQQLKVLRPNTSDVESQQKMDEVPLVRIYAIYETKKPFGRFWYIRFPDGETFEYRLDVSEQHQGPVDQFWTNVQTGEEFDRRLFIPETQAVLSKIEVSFRRK